MFRKSRMKGYRVCLLESGYPTAIWQICWSFLKIRRVALFWTMLMTRVRVSLRVAYWSMNLPSLPTTTSPEQLLKYMQCLSLFLITSSAAPQGTLLTPSCTSPSAAMPILLNQLCVPKSCTGSQWWTVTGLSYKLQTEFYSSSREGQDEKCLLQLQARRVPYFQAGMGPRIVDFGGQRVNSSCFSQGTEVTMLGTGLRGGSLRVGLRRLGLGVFSLTELAMSLSSCSYSSLRMPMISFWFLNSS